MSQSHVDADERWRSLEGREFADKQEREEATRLSSPIWGLSLMSLSAVSFLIKPVVFPLTGRRVYFDERPSEDVICGYFEASHRSIVVAGVVFVLLSLLLLRRVPRNR